MAEAKTQPIDANVTCFLAARVEELLRPSVAVTRQRHPSGPGA